jgi:hypothetical protein
LSGLTSSRLVWCQACLGLASNRPGLASSRLVWLQACLVWLQAVRFGFKPSGLASSLGLASSRLVGFKPGFGIKPSSSASSWSDLASGWSGLASSRWFGFKPVKTIGLQIDIGTGPAGGEAMKKGRMLLPAMPKAQM